MIHLILVFISAYLSHFIAHTRQMHRVTSSALSSLILIAIMHLLALYSQTIALSVPSYEVTIFGASFLGMSTHQRIEYKTLWFSALLYFALFNFSKFFIIPLGGTLGFLAFIATVTTVLIADFLRKRSKFFAPELVKE